MENNNEEKKDVILIAKMYTGSYVNRRFNNIGHEIINFIEPDNGDKIYGYIINDGKIPKKYYKGNIKIKTILFISKSKKGKAKIIAKVNNPEIIDDYKNEQGNIKYGGKCLTKIMEQCAENRYGRYITYRCDKKDIQFAKEGQYIDIENPKKKDSAKENSEKFGISYLRIKTYISKADKEEYNLISKLTDSKNKEIWENTEINEDKVKKIGINEHNEPSFMDLIQAEYNEEIISNMLKYYFEKENVFQKFMNKLVENKGLNVAKINIDENIKIYREKHVKTVKKGSKEQGRIDLFIEDEKNKNVIVIENKIESSIHGKAYEDGKTKKSQLEVYYDWINNLKIDDNEERKTGKKEKTKLKKKYEKYNKIFLIFVPNYRKVEIEDELDQIANKIKNEYKIITYSEIYDFFNKIDRNIFYRDEKSREAYYFEDFLNTLSIHKTESNYEMIRRRFINAINNTKENK